MGETIRYDCTAYAIMGITKSFCERSRRKAKAGDIFRDRCLQCSGTQREDHMTLAAFSEEELSILEMLDMTGESKIIADAL